MTSLIEVKCPGGQNTDVSVAELIANKIKANFAWITVVGFCVCLFLVVVFNFAEAFNSRK